MADTDKRVTRDDLEAGFRDLQGGVIARVDRKKPSIVTGAMVGGVVLIIIVFLLGRRVGKKKTTVVEIRRV